MKNEQPKADTQSALTRFLALADGLNLASPPISDPLDIHAIKAAAHYIRSDQARRQKAGDGKANKHNDKEPHPVTVWRRQQRDRAREAASKKPEPRKPTYKPCPSCGEQPRGVRDRLDRAAPYFWVVECSTGKCPKPMRAGRYPSLAIARAEWNKGNVVSVGWTLNREEKSDKS